MNSLLNPEIIKAAATSTLGILSLMCLIIAVVSLGLFRSSPVWAKLFVFILLLAGVSGFGAAVLRQQKPQPSAPEASREFMVGHWQFESAYGEAEAARFYDYAEDGHFKGKNQEFVNGNFRRELVSGTWQFIKLAKDQFRLELTYDNGAAWNGTFRILDHDRIHNLDENYDLVRVAR